MKVRFKILALLGLLAVMAAWLFWFRPVRPVAVPGPGAPAVIAHGPAAPAAAATNAVVAADSVHMSAASTNRLTFRLANTTKSIKQLTGDRHAILLENAFIDTTASLNLNIPSQLKSTGEPGAFIVQARGMIGGAFRDAIAGAGGTIVSYIPNGAYLVQISSAGAAVLADNSLVQAVLPYEPYYKVQSALLGLAVNQKPLPAGTYLTLGLYNGSAAATEAQLQTMGAPIVSQDRSPFGPIVRVRPPTDWIALANLPGVQLVEATYLRKTANDLSRVTMGISTNTTQGATNDWLGLTGKNVLVEVNDTGIDPTHPDFSATGTAGAGPSGPTRVTGDNSASLMDTDGHGTHVAGIIAGNGSMSYPPPGPVNVGALASGSVSNADFRGKAPLATLFSVGGIDGGYDTNLAVGDSYLQEVPALTNALISNNSWEYGNAEYDLAAASYDAAVRDAVPEMTGPQPVLFVFAAGNDGGGDDGGSGGSADTVSSPGSAKNVLTVGALEQLRNITNIVTELNGSSNAIWQGETASSFLVPGYSSRGNVGVQTEGPYGRFKPDVVAPGTFVVSTRSQDWDEYAYYNPTNYHDNVVSDFVLSNSLAYGEITVPQNAVGVVIQVSPNDLSPVPFPTNFPIYVSASGVPDPTDPTTYDIFSDTGNVSIPPDSGGNIGSISDLQNGGVIYAIGDPTNAPINFNVLEEVITTNDYGNELIILSNLNNSISGNPDSNVKPHYYRYETGTSMATAAVSGMLALMQDFFTNTLHTTPSPALLKAMVINGAQLTGEYQYAVTNTINYEGWGQVNLPDSLPAALTNTVAGSTNTPLFFVDQSPTNVLATGDSRTYLVSVPSPAARAQVLRITLAWTDPPGNPAAAIKLVNNLELIVTNLANGNVYYANNFSPFGTPPYSTPSPTNLPPAFDLINNVQNIFLSPTLGTNYSVTVFGAAVNVNAVTEEQTNIVQDFALVIADGTGSNTNGISVTPTTPALASSTQPDVNFLAATNGIYFNQFAGSDAPWLSTNDLGFGTNLPYGSGTYSAPYETNAIFSIGQTNQWHFFVITNTMAATNNAFTNAAFIVFLADTASLPREGVFAGTDANSTRPESELSLLVASPQNFPSAGDPNAAELTNLNVNVISNCLFGLNGDASSVVPGGSKFVAYSNSQPNQIYYIGVLCQDQTAAQFAFVPVFSDQPFSTLDQNGNEYVHAFNVPANIPSGNNAHPGVSYVMGLALTPMQIRRVIATNTITDQNFGDLIGPLSHNSTAAVLNNHDGLGPVVNDAFVYDDSGQGDIPGAIHTDGPGSLNNFQGQEAAGLWVLNEICDSPGSTGTVENLQLRIEPHRTQNGLLLTVTVPPMGWYYDYVTVPVGYTNLLVVATNLAPTSVPPILLYVKDGSEPTLADTNDNVSLTNCVLGTYPTGVNPGNSISLGPPLAPGTYYIGIYNPDTVAHTVVYGAFLSFNTAAETPGIYPSTDTPLPIADDALTLSPQAMADFGLDNSTIFVPSTETIQGLNVGLRVDHPRISDMVFTLISPDGTRYLLMENRGAQTTNGCGATTVTTNLFSATANGTALSNTNYLNLDSVSGTLPITYNFYTAPDQMTIYYGTNVSPAYLIYDTGVTNNPPTGSGGPQNTTPASFILSYGPTNGIVSTYVTIVMDQFPTNFVAGTNRSDAWTYTAGGVVTNYQYLTFTEDTNLTTTPIKYAPPPFVPQGNFSTNYTLSDFETAAPGAYAAPATINDESIWTVLNNQVSVVSDPTNAQAGSNFLALASGTISNSIATVPGAQYTLQYYYRGPGIVAWWRGESNTLDSIGGNNGTTPNGIGYTTGEVGTAFNLNGVNQYVLVNPATPSSLDVGQGSGMTFECWINPNTVSAEEILFSYELALGTANGSDVGPTLAIHPASSGGILYANLTDTSGGGAIFTSPMNLLVAGAWQHIAMTYDKASGLAAFYINGVSVTQANVGSFTPQTSYTNLMFGGHTTYNSESSPGAVYSGKMDELSLYNRALSASEIKAIYLAESAGKFAKNEYTNSPALSLAEATVTVPGVITNLIYGNNTNWQPQTITFTATQTTTPIVISGLEPGMALDTFTLQGSKASRLYYQPEQSLTPLVGTSAYGDWQLEVLDDRAGATNPIPMLDSWDLSFTFANTNYTIPLGNLNSGMAETNYAPPGSLTWLQIIVPTNAIAQTNTLFYASLPLNIYFSTNTPPTTNSPFGTEEQTNSVGGTVVLYTNSVPLPMVPGTTNYLGVQNLNNFGANYAIDVTFDLVFPPPASNTPAAPYASTLPATSVTGTNAQLNGFATPNGTNAGAWFQWGITTNYGNITPTVNVGSGFGVVYVTNSITNLVFAQVYHARLVVTNALGTAYGADEQFAPGTPIVWGNDTLGQTNVPAGLSNVVAVAGGLNHSLALLYNGTVTGWGDNSFGQITIPSGLTNAAAIAAGGNDSLALLANGTVMEWGDNSAVQTVVPASATNVVMIAAGSLNSVALLNNGNVIAWGDNTYGQTTVPSVLVSNVVAVAAGGNDVMALLNNGTVVSWGASTGQTIVPASVSNVVAIAEGDGSHSLALTNYYGVAGWGTLANNNLPVPSDLSSNVVAIAAGQDDSLVLLNNGSVVAWGNNNFNQTNVPAGLPAVFAVACGATHDLVLASEPPVLPPYAYTMPATSVTGTNAQINGFATANNRVSSAWFNWGPSTNYAFQTTPVIVNGGYNVIYVTNAISGLIFGKAYHCQLVVSNSLGIAYGFDQLLVAGSTVAWGDNTYGQSTPPAGISNVVTIAAGGYHSLEALTDGTMQAWGDDANFQTNIPAGLSNVVAVAGGFFHSLAVQSNGLVTAWGDNNDGQTNVPSNASNVVTVAGGGYASVALQNNGLLATWGDNTFGQTSIPAGLSNVVEVAYGSEHSLALLNNGTVVAWGTNNYGQATVPAGLDNVVAVSAGAYHSLALQNNGMVVAWGDNSLGQTNVPAGLTNVIAIAAGGYHNLVLRNDGSVVTWGDGSLGQTNVPAAASNVVAVAAGFYHSLVLTSPFNINLNLFPNPTNGPLTNVVSPGGINWIQVNVPTNAIAATNTLLFATLPVNLWWSTNVPPTVTNPNDAELLANSTAGSVVLYPNTPPPTIVPGGTYYLGVQNLNAQLVTNAVQVTFEYSTPAPTNVLITFGGPGDYRGVGIKYLNGSVYICGDSTLAGGFLAGVNLPLLATTTPAWFTNWPYASPQDTLDGITASINGIYAAGANYNLTTDTVGGKEQKGLVVKFPFAGPVGPGAGGDIWNAQTPSAPGALPYGGFEGLHAATVANESGVNYIYACGNGQANGANGGRLFLSKLDESGNVLWTASDGYGTVSTGGFAVTVLNTNIYVAGANNGEPYLRKFDPTGNSLGSWQNPVSGQYYGMTTVQNYIYAVGYANIPGNNTDFLIDKWDANGNLIWSRTYDRNNDQDQLNAAVNFNSRLFAVGFTYGQTAGGADAVILEIDPNTGNLLSTNLFGGSLDDKANAVDTDNTNLYVVGESRSFDNGTNQVLLFSFTPQLSTVVNGTPITNVVASNSITWFQVNVPPNAIAATNTLLFATLPVNLWWSTNVPPSVTSPNDHELLANTTSGSVVLYTNTPPPTIVPGGTYYLGVQNQNSQAVTNAIEVTFEYSPPVLQIGSPTTNNVPPESINWFEVDVPTNAVAATNALLFATLPVDLWYSTNRPPTISNSGDVELLTNSLNGTNVIDTSTTVPLLVPGGVYYLGVQNTNSVTVTNAIQVNFRLAVVVPPTYSIFSIVQTNSAGTNGFLLTWYAPVGTQFHLQWTPSLLPVNWKEFKGVISFTSFITATNSEFQYFDDGSQAGPFGSMRFYRLHLLNSPTNTAPEFLYQPTNLYVNPLTTIIVTNTAHDWDVPAQTLTYLLVNSLTGGNLATLSPGGVINWTPDLSQAGSTNVITTIVNDNGLPGMSTTNVFTVIVNPIPPVPSIAIVTNGVSLSWSGPTNEEFEIRWTTNLAPPTNWMLFPPPPITSTNGMFNFTDTNAPFLIKFYQLILLP